MPIDNNENKEFKPVIVAFCCNWCSYAGADGAGVARLQMPTNFRIIRTMCSARVDPEFVLRAFAKGADGVMVLGCHPVAPAGQEATQHPHPLHRPALTKLLKPPSGWATRETAL